MRCFERLFGRPRRARRWDRSGIRLRGSKIKSKTFIRRPRASLAERSVGPGRVHTDERRVSAVARTEPTGPTRSGWPDDGLREIGDWRSSSRIVPGFHFVQSGLQPLFSSSLPGLTRQSKRPCGWAASRHGPPGQARWRRAGRPNESCWCKQTRGMVGRGGRHDGNKCCPAERKCPPACYCRDSTTENSPLRMRGARFSA